MVDGNYMQGVYAGHRNGPLSIFDNCPNKTSTLLYNIWMEQLKILSYRT